MKKLMVVTNHVALVYKQGELKKVLTAGNYWLGFGEQAQIYNMAELFNAPISLDVLLQHNDFVAITDVITVGDNELVLVYQDKSFKKVLNAGKYAFWKGLTAYTFIRVDLTKYEITEPVDRNLLEKSPMSLFTRVYRVESHEQALMFVDGKFERVLGPGNYIWWKNSTVIQVAKTDMRQLAMEITGQEILTKDKAQLRINFTIQYKVADVMKALLENRDFDKQLYVVMQLALREFVGRMTFDELMEGKERISEQVLALTAGKAAALGVQLITCGVKDIILPGDVKDIMNQVLIAEKKAQANIITRREETASTRSLLNTAKMMEENAMLYKLKEMEYVEKIAEKINTISVSGSGQIVEQLKQIFIKQ